MRTAPNVDISVIIPTRDRASVLRESLAALERQNLDADRWELVVVDDGSEGEETPNVVSSLHNIRAVCLRQFALGAAAARNTAIARARGRVLVFLDDDAFVGPSFLREHLALHVGARSALVAGGIIQTRKIPEFVDEAPGLRAYHRHPMPGGNSSAPASAVRAVGGFDPWFSSYGWQDQELAHRLLRHGLKRRFAWRAPIYHYKPPSYDQDMRAQLAREFDRGRMGARFYHKHHSLAVGITTKTWGPLRFVIAAASNATGTDSMRERLQRGELDGSAIPPWRAALLRARAESAAGGDELRRLTTPNAHRPH